MTTFTDKLAVSLGAISGAIIANMNFISDILLKLILTIIFAVVGAIFSFYTKKYLEKKHKN